MPGAIVLLHGVASNRTRWSEFVATTALRERWALLAPDLRGNGDFVDRGRIGVEEWCADIAALLDRERHARALLIGHCLGANVALHFAARFPQRVLGLVLIEPMLPEALTGAMNRVRRLRSLLHLLIPAVRVLNAHGIRRRRLAPLDLRALDQRTREALARGPEGEAALAKYASPVLDLRTTATAAYLQSLLAVTEPLPDAASIAAPVLSLVAERSTFTNGERLRAYLDRMADHQTIELPARHWIPTERPREMREAIEAWIARRFPAA